MKKVMMIVKVGVTVKAAAARDRHCWTMLLS
jgi:hypothetical protein